MEASRSVLKAPAPPTDPNLATEQQRATDSLAQSLQVQSQGDMAALMARYGTNLAMAGYNGGSPLVTSAPSGLARPK